ncbi:MAG TPA: hypothetical protein ENK02_04100 [Planctomycetes bacterium]|nr:hypothetical protein [Planctomycetota bacterium]
MPTAKLQYRPFEPGDEERILETFNLTFRQVCGQGYVDRGSAQWRWEYLDNPAGSLAYLAVTEQGQVAAQYAGVLMRVHLGAEDRDLVFMHAVDSMVHPDFRRGLKKRPLFLEIAEAYFETYGGKAFDLGFGYPVRPAWRIGERYLGYRKIRDLDFLLLDLAGAPSPSDPGALQVEHIHELPAEIDALYQRLRPRFACMVAKDRAYLQWRYQACPGAQYHLLYAHQGGQARGLAVLRTEGALVPGAATLGDLLVDPEDQETLAALLGQAQTLATAHGCPQLMTVTNPNLPLHQSYRSLGFRSEPSAHWLERRLGSRDWTAGLDQAWLDQHWFYCLGDSDLF